jgi:hypothetical protein
MGILGRYRNTASCLSTADITITITMVMVGFVMLGSPGLSIFELHMHIHTKKMRCSKKRQAL